MSKRWRWTKHHGLILLQAYGDPDPARLHKVGRVVSISNGLEAGDQVIMRFKERLLRYYFTPAN